MSFFTYSSKKPYFPSGDTGLNSLSEIMFLNCNYGTKIKKKEIIR